MGNERGHTPPDISLGGYKPMIRQIEVVYRFVGVSVPSDKIFGSKYGNHSYTYDVFIYVSKSHYFY